MPTLATDRIVRLMTALALLTGAAGAQLDLPKKKVAPKDGERPELVRPLPRGDLAPRDERGLDLSPGTVPDTTTPDDPLAAARFVFAELDRTKDPDSTLAAGAVATLVSLGEPGFQLARDELLRTRRVHAVRFAVAARVLLHGGPGQRELVARRLEDKVHSRVAGDLLRELLATDPVLANPAYLVGLLSHPTSAMRQAAYEELASRADTSLLPHLAVALDTAKSGGRLAVLDLAREIDDPAALALAFSALGDGTASVAARAVEVLAASDDPSVPETLRGIAFERFAPDRRGAYALLALAELESRTGSLFIGDDDVPTLLVGLTSQRAIVAGACAISLADVGFRSESFLAPGWLDREVPHTLVRLATGDVFHADFSSLQGPGLDRLALLTGQAFGGDGARWQDWWVQHAEGFRARRARLPARIEDAGGLLVELERGAPFVVLRVYGPERAVLAADRAATEHTIFLTREGAERLLAVLDGEGVLGPSRLPGRFGSSLVPARRLRVEVGPGEKTFEVARGVELGWFERILAAIAGLERENRWQAWIPRENGETGVAAWLRARDWWHEAPESDRARRLVDLVLSRLPDMPRDARGGGLELLTELAEEGALRPGDVQPLLALLDAEVEYGGPGSRAARLFALARGAARSLAPERPLEASLARLLVDALIPRFDPVSGQDATAVIAAAEPELALALARDPDPRLRALSADALAADGSVEARDALDELTRDPAPAVRAAACAAYGARRVSGGQGLLVPLAREGDGLVRAAALRSLAELGAPELRELALIGISDEDEVVQDAAVAALALRADPETSGILLALFARGPSSRFFEPARRGLARLPELPEDDLLRLLVTAPRPTRRETAILLSERGVAAAASELMRLLTEEPGDARVAAELRVLTCLELGSESDDLARWWEWWDGVVHSDSLSWLLAAAEREGLTAPEARTLAGAGTRSGAEFLLRVIREATSAPLRARARRELSRLLEQDVNEEDADGDWIPTAIERTFG